MDSSGSASGSSHSVTSGSRNAPRRLSYASVASGAGSSLQNIRPGTSGPPATTPTPSTYAAIRNSEWGRATESQTDVNMYNTKDNAGRATPLPEYSRKYANVGRVGPNAFFVPSYLKDSRYVAKLEAAKSRASRERSSSSSTPSVSVASTGTNVQRLAPSHRGMTYDIIESNPPKDEDDITPLPSRWSNQDKYPGLDVTNDGLDVKYNGSVGKAETEAASVRADYPMSPACGIYYFEVEIKQKSNDCAIAIGFSTQKASLERLPGWEADSWAYHGDDGRAFSGEHQGRDYGPTFAAGDTIGCGLNFATGQAFFTRNGMDLGVAFRELKNVKPFPSVGIKKYSGAVVTVNFGQKPFLHDIDERVEMERMIIRQEIKRTKTTSLRPGLNEQSLIQELVAQFLSHGGYVQTAQAFAEQRSIERKALDETRSSLEEELDTDATSAMYRQQIRRAILSGDIDTALLTTDRHFPSVLQNSPGIVFRLKCRKWVELISKASDLRTSPVEVKQGALRSGPGIEASARVKIDDDFDLQMELDEDQQSTNATPTAAGSRGDNDLAYNSLLTEAMNYGQILQREYRDEPNTDYRRTLADIFSLVAYNEPRDSVHGHLLDSDGRLKVAEELNSAILVSLGRSPTAALEKMYKQTEALIDVLSQEGGPASFVNLKSDFV